jgi:predicted  nucleic acid-binding Zn-ribbon protein
MAAAAQREADKLKHELSQLKAKLKEEEKEKAEAQAQAEAQVKCTNNVQDQFTTHDL